MCGICRTTTFVRAERSATDKKEQCEIYWDKCESVSAESIVKRIGSIVLCDNISFGSTKYNFGECYKPWNGKSCLAWDNICPFNCYVNKTIHYKVPATLAETWQNETYVMRNTQSHTVSFDTSARLDKSTKEPVATSQFGLCHN